MKNVSAGATATQQGSRRSHPLALWTIAGFVASAVGAAYAQTAPADAAATTPAAPAGSSTGQDASGALTEVVVTATRRSENIQNVPIAVTAFTAESLQQSNLTNVHALGNLTPGVNLDQGAPFSGDRSVLSASIRGVGQDDFAFNLNPAVGVYLDGVYLARTIGANQDLLDVERVEILKGPQGTLFGANTEGGAISIVTHTPGNEEKFTGQVTMGSLNRRDIGFTADIPLIKDTLLSSVTVSSQDRDGYVNVVPYPGGTPSFVVDPQTAYPKAGYETNDNYGGYGVQTIRGKLLWLASDKTTITFTADYNRQAQTALPYTVLGVFSGNAGASTFSTLYNLCISNTTVGAVAAAVNTEITGNAAAGPGGLFANLCTQPRARVAGVSTGGAPLLGAGYALIGGATIAGANPLLNAALMGTPAYLGSNSPRLYFNEAAANTGNIDTTYATGPDFANNNYFGFSLTGTHELSDDMSLKSISGYRQIVWKTGTDLDGTPETLQEVTDHQHQWQVSQEFQLQGKALDNNLNYVGGLYYFEEAGYVHDYVPFESLLYVYDIQNDANNKNEAAFVHADYKFNNFSFVAGGRYTHVQEEFIGGQADLNCFPTDCAIGGNFPLGSGTVLRYFPPGDNSQSWNVFDPTLAAQFHFNDDVMAYLSWGKGFKAGGWTTRLSAVSASSKDDTFSPEYTKTWELGLKSEFFEHHLKANAAVFYTDYTGIQLNIQEGISPVYTNAGDAKIKGAEFELQGAVLPGLTLNLSGSYIDAYYTSIDSGANFPQYALPDGSTVCPAGPPICQFQGNGIALNAKLPKTPKYKATFYPEYTYVLGNQASLRLITAFTYTAEMFNDSLNTPQLRRPASRNLDASLHYISANEKYDVALGGTNITDDRYITVGSPNYGAGEVGGTYNEPAEWYLRLTARF